MLRRRCVWHFAVHIANLFNDMNDLAGAIVYPDGEDFAGAGAGIILKHFKCQVIAGGADPATAIVIPSTAFSTTTFVPTSGCTNDAPIGLKGTRRGGLCQNRRWLDG